MAFLPDGRFLVTERNPGTIRLGTADGALSEPLIEVEDFFRPIGETGRSQAGLFDIKLHPDFDANGFVYWVYSRATERGSAVVVQRAEWDNAGSRLGTPEDVWVMQDADQDASALHYGGRMAWLPDGTLVLSIGERRNLERAQDLEDQAGGTIRMTADGEAPSDNPAWDDDADEYVYTTGNRNVKRSPLIRSQAISGPSTMDRSAAMKSTASMVATTMAGPGSPAASTIPARRSAWAHSARG